MKNQKLWVILSGILAAILISISQGMQPFSFAKYLVASVGGGCFGLVLILLRMPVKK